MMHVRSCVRMLAHSVCAFGATCGAVRLASGQQKRDDERCAASNTTTHLPITLQPQGHLWNCEAMGGMPMAGCDTCTGSDAASCPDPFSKCAEGSLIVGWSLRLRLP